MDGSVIIGTELDTKSFDEQIKQTEQKLANLEKEYEIYSKQAQKGSKTAKAAMQETGLEIEKTRNKLIGLRKQQDKANEKQPSNLLQWVQNFGKETENNIKKVACWGLALIGIRGIVSFLTKSLNTLTQYDEQLAADVNYIRFALATTLKPVIEYLVGLAHTLLSYVGYIAKAWFGVNIFANATAKSMSKAAKSAKEIKKNSLSFDKFTKLDGDSGGGDESDGGVAPSFDLSNLEDVPIPSWIQWIADNKDTVIAGLMGIAAGILAVKLGIVGLTGGVIIALIVALFALIINNWEKLEEILQKGIDWLKERADFIKENFGAAAGFLYNSFTESLEMILSGFGDFFGGIKKVFDGIIQLVTGVFTGKWKQAWEGVKKIFSGIFESLVGIVKAVLGTLVAVLSGIGTTIAMAVTASIKAIINYVLATIEGKINGFFSLINGAIKLINKMPGVNISKIQLVKFPRLAKGGIINMPGRGVNYGGANIGERGQEGVIPLTDNQQMELIGEAIGKHVTVYVDFTQQMDSRVISREMKKAEQNRSFMRNGG